LNTNAIFMFIFFYKNSMLKNGKCMMNRVWCKVYSVDIESNQ